MMIMCIVSSSSSSSSSRSSSSSSSSSSSNIRALVQALPSPKSCGVVSRGCFRNEPGRSDSFRLRTFRTSIGSVNSVWFGTTVFPVRRGSAYVF